VRTGALLDVQARVLSFLGTAGVAIRPWRTGPSRLFGASVRADYVLMNQSVTHTSATAGDGATRGRPMSGLDAFFETEWRLWEDADLFIGTGIEAMLATTYVDLNGSRMATLPPICGVLDVGLRLGF
jgi:hypothetical protein